MKTTEKSTEPMADAAPESRLSHPSTPLLPARDKRSLIKWSTEQQIQGVSKQLAGIKQVAIRSETEGDYFKSGDLAYQIQEIVRATAELFARSQRARG